MVSPVAQWDGVTEWMCDVCETTFRSRAAALACCTDHG